MIRCDGNIVVPELDLVEQQLFSATFMTVKSL